MHATPGTPVEGDDHGFARIDGPGHHHDRSRAAAEDAGQRVIRNLLEAELEVGLPPQEDEVKAMGFPEDLDVGIADVLQGFECHTLLVTQRTAAIPRICSVLRVMSCRNS